MDIYDEQAPFTKEQADYLAIHYVKKTIARSGQNITRQVESENNLAASNFLKRLVLDRGVIVSSQDCSEMELVFARKEDRCFVDDEGLGYVLRPKDWLTKAYMCISIYNSDQVSEDLRY